MLILHPCLMARDHDSAKDLEVTAPDPALAGSSAGYCPGHDCLRNNNSTSPLISRHAADIRSQ